MSRFEKFIINYWWVILFILGCGVWYEQSAQHLNRELVKLGDQLVGLKNERHYAIKIQDRLRLQIHSQSDFSWIELTLMKGLGLKPKDQTKIIFE